MKKQWVASHAEGYRCDCTAGGKNEACFFKWCGFFVLKFQPAAATIAREADSSLLGVNQVAVQVFSD